MLGAEDSEWTWERPLPHSYEDHFLQNYKSNSEIFNPET